MKKMRADKMHFPHRIMKDIKIDAEGSRHDWRSAEAGIG
jgi:hypothetical protein